MASRRILSNSKLAPIQELAVNPYSSFNSRSINKITRIVSGGKDKDVVVNGLDVNSKTDKRWYAGPELLPSLDDEKWSGEFRYVINKTADGLHDIDPIIHFELPHERSYGFSYIKCQIDDSCVNHLYKSSYQKIYEVTFKLVMGTPKTIVAKINDCEVTIDHPESGKTYTLPLTKVFLHDTLENGLTFTFGAVLDAADPECKMETVSNKTYICVSDIGLRMMGYEYPEPSRSVGPVHDEYAIYGNHPTHTLEITPGVAIKDDVMLEEMAPSIDKFKKFKLDLSSNLSWIKNNPYTLSDFNKSGESQYAYQCNDNGNPYIPRLCKFENGELKVCIKDHSGTDMWVSPTDDITLTYGYEDGDVTRTIKNCDRGFAFDSYSDDDEFHNFTLYSDGAVISDLDTYSNTVIVCFVDDDGKYHVIGHKINIIKAGQGVKARDISPDTPEITEVDTDEQATNITFDNGTSFEIPIYSHTLPKKISDYGENWRNRIRGFVSVGPTKISGSQGNFNDKMIQWGYVVLYYAYFENPKPNASYIGIIRESDLEYNRDDYLVLAKVRFIDPNTVDIISYENRQSKQIPNAQRVDYYSTCEYPDIWGGDIPDSVTDAINELARYDHNFARLIRFKHDFDAPVDTSFYLANPDGRKPQRTPFIHVNNDGHLERKIRIDKSAIIIKSVNDNYTKFVPEVNTQFVSDNDTTFVFTDSTDVTWIIRFNPNPSDLSVVSDYNVDVKAALGKYDEKTGKVAYGYVCFSNIGPFKFVDVDNGNVAFNCDWLYYEDILVYPTSPSLSLDSQSLIYPTAPYSTKLPDGTFADTDRGTLSGEKYIDIDSGKNGGRFLLSYNDPSSSGDSGILNSKKNHFSYLVFRNRLLISNYFLKMLDILPKRSIGKNAAGNHVEEALIDGRVVVGGRNSEDENVHIESTDTTISDNMKNGNLLHTEVTGGVSEIKSSDYAIPNKKTPLGYDYDKDVSGSEKYELIDNSLITAKKRNGDTIDIISSGQTITANGDGSLLSSGNKDGLTEIKSTKHKIDDNLINGNIIRAKVDASGDKLESTKYAIPNKKTGSGNPYNLDYDFTTNSSEANYTLTDEALLMAKKRNDNTVDIISTKFTIQANDRGQVLISQSLASGLTSIQSSKHFINDHLKNGNLIIADNPKIGDVTSDELKSSIYSIPDTKIGDDGNPMDSTYSYTGDGTYKLIDGALLTAKKRNDDNVDIISSKYTISANNDKEIVTAEYQNPDDPIHSLIDIKSSGYTVGDITGQWYQPKVELRSDSWWNNGKPRIVVVIDTVHYFTIRVSEIVKSIHQQITDGYYYGDGDIPLTEDTFKSLFNNDINVNKRKVCDITVVLDLTNGNNRAAYNDELDGYKAIESHCKSKFILVNDINKVEIAGPKVTYFKPYVEMTFDYSDSIKSKGGNIHYEGGELIYGFDTDNEFEGIKRSAEHLHSEPLEYIVDKWKLIDDYDKKDKNFIWRDGLRGYNNTKIYDDSGKLIKSEMQMYPVDNKNDLTDTSALEYDPSSTKANSGYGYCRGPLNYVFAGSKGEYTFNHVKTNVDTEGITYPVGPSGRPLFTCSKCNDLIYGDAKYYIISDQF